ncbi:hypothetical protein AAFF_G00234960 [Aldrovandia affinis]|uniref:ribonuclease H n=1 Tax=Aldrovandia affinis TaxID=143900 RepID=A0AAD7SV97_9TELE|nr:hypothetical protein AAFF_G00234960 [Aldrovandia affinis]
MVKDSYPLPRIDESPDQITRSRWFASLNLRSGYWQVGLTSDVKPKTAFTTGSGLSQFTTMPFGFCNVPTIFERLMERVLKGIPRETCLDYLDDILVHEASFQSTLDALNVVLTQIAEARLKLHPEKCRLMQQEVTFLGHRLSEQGVATEDGKISAVRDWPVPCSLRQLRAFLGLGN